jgi:cell division protein ZapE
MTLTDEYCRLVAEGRLQSDAAQDGVVAKLATLSEKLNAQAPSRQGLLGRLFRRTPTPVPRGLYIWGPVGGGKTLLMDLFSDSVLGWPKRRVHFHAFMQEVHAARTRLGGDAVINRIANELAISAKLLCLDEMQITDIADAMIIGRLYEALLARGVVLVTTSNLPPEGLYKDGLNRQLFLPFITRLQETLDVVELVSARDYRLNRLRAKDTYLFPGTAENRVIFNGLWAQLTDGAQGQAELLDLLGRKLTVPKVAHGCAAFTFAELCGAALGPADYLTIAASYRTVFLSGVPQLKTSQRNEAKRLILMIDTFYDAGTRLVILAEVAPENLAPKNPHGFEFLRTASRLREMQSASWWGGQLGQA